MRYSTLPWQSNMHEPQEIDAVAGRSQLLLDFSMAKIANSGGADIGVRALAETRAAATQRDPH